MYSNPKGSVTAMEHRLIEVLAAAPFDDLHAEFYGNATEFFSFDEFRRLYNDAVESMRFYRSVVANQNSRMEALEQRICELEDALRELTDS